MDVNQRITLLMENLDISNYKFCQLTGITPQTLSNVTNLKINASIDVVQKILAKYDGLKSGNL